MLRKLISRFNRSLTESMVSSRRRHTAPVKIWFEPEINSERACELARSLCVFGETYDISRSGIAFVVPSIRLKEKYLVGQDRMLNIEMDLPTGHVHMKVMGRRYEKVGIHISTEKFLVGANIEFLAGTDKENYETFLRRGHRGTQRTAGSLELGID
jgi:hypothetical protein